MVSGCVSMQVLVTALLDTIRKSFVNMVFLMALLIFIFGILGFYFFGTGESGDKENWGSLGSAMLTLFAFVTVSSLTLGVPLSALHLCLNQSQSLGRVQEIM